MKKFFLIILVFAVSFYLSIEYLGDKLIKNRLEKNISSELNRDVSIDKLNIDYLSGKADMRGFSILNKEYDGYLRESHNHQEVSKLLEKLKKQTEVEGIINALNGQFIRPVPGGDLIR